MNVSVTINLGANEYAADLAGNATELAEKILVAIGGDESKDMVNVMISDAGSAGGMPMLPPPVVVDPPPEPYPDQTLPEPEPHPDQTLPEPPRTRP